MKLRGLAIWLLLRIYPVAWRREFGAEFEDLLRRWPLSPIVMVNVIASGIRERVIGFLRRMVGGSEVTEGRLGARYDWMTKIISGIVVALLVAVFVRATWAGAAPVFAALVLAVAGLSFAFSPRGYEISGGMFRVKRLIGDVVFPLDGLRFVRDATAADFWGSVRLWGSGGVFGYYGWFWSKALGRSRWYVTDRSRAVVVTDGDQVILVSPEDHEGFVTAISPASAGASATSTGFVRGGVPPSRGIGFAVTGTGLALVAAAILYSPGRPPVDLTKESLVIHSRFFGMTVPASSVDVGNVRVVDLKAEPGWKPVLRTGGFGNSFYRAGNFRTAGGRAVKLFTTGSQRLVLIPPSREDGTPVLLDAADPDQLAARVRAEWAGRRGQ